MAVRPAKRARNPTQRCTSDTSDNNETMPDAASVAASDQISVEDGISTERDEGISLANTSEVDASARPRLDPPEIFYDVYHFLGCTANEEALYVKLDRQRWGVPYEPALLITNFHDDHHPEQRYYSVSEVEFISDEARMSMHAAPFRHVDGAKPWEPNGKQPARACKKKTTAALGPRPVSAKSTNRARTTTEIVLPQTWEFLSLEMPARQAMIIRIWLDAEQQHWRNGNKEYDISIEEVYKNTMEQMVEMNIKGARLCIGSDDRQQGMWMELMEGQGTLRFFFSDKDGVARSVEEIVQLQPEVRLAFCNPPRVVQDKFSVQPLLGNWYDLETKERRRYLSAYYIAMLVTHRPEWVKDGHRPRRRGRLIQEDEIRHLVDFDGAEHDMIRADAFMWPPCSKSDLKCHREVCRMVNFASCHPHSDERIFSVYSLDKDPRSRLQALLDRYEDSSIGLGNWILDTDDGEMPIDRLDCSVIKLSYALVKIRSMDLDRQNSNDETYSKWLSTNDGATFQCPILEALWVELKRHANLLVDARGAFSLAHHQAKASAHNWSDTVHGSASDYRRALYKGWQTALDNIFADFRLSNRDKAMSDYDETMDFEWQKADPETKDLQIWTLQKDNEKQRIALENAQAEIENLKAMLQQKRSEHPGGASD